MKKISKIKLLDSVDVLDASAMKTIFGGVYTGVTCLYKCKCTHGSGEDQLFTDNCLGGGPWDRVQDGRCSTGLQTCEFIGVTYPSGSIIY